MRSRLLFLFLFAGCGSVPIEPELQEEPQMQVPLLILPKAFQEIPLTIVQSTTLENTIFESLYPTSHNLPGFVNLKR